MTPEVVSNFKLDHIGVAVKSLEEGFQFYKALGFSEIKIEEVPSEQVKVGMLELGNECRIELLESTHPEGPVGKFISKRGPGIHHICLRVVGIEALVKKLKSQGIKLINEVPRKGAHNCRVVFVHPQSAGGILLELSEKVKA